MQWAADEARVQQEVARLNAALPKHGLKPKSDQYIVARYNDPGELAARFRICIFPTHLLIFCTHIRPLRCKPALECRYHAYRLCLHKVLTCCS